MSDFARPMRHRRMTSWRKKVRISSVSDRDWGVVPVVNIKGIAPSQLKLNGQDFRRYLLKIVD
jgi:hypothetical protein